MKPDLEPFKEGDRARADGLVHVVAWATHRSWDGFCSNVVEDHQPNYYVFLADWDETLYEEASRAYVTEAEPTTCLVCLVTMLKG